MQKAAGHSGPTLGNASQARPEPNWERSGRSTQVEKKTKTFPKFSDSPLSFAVVSVLIILKKKKVLTLLWAGAVLPA